MDSTRDSSTDRRRRAGLAALLWLVTVGFLWAGTIAYIESIRSDILADAERDTISLVNQFETRVSNVLNGADDYVKSARRAFEREGGIDGVRAFMRDVPPSLRDISHITVTDAKGVPILISTGIDEKKATPGKTAFDRPYFQHQKTNQGDAPYISVSRKGKNTGVFTIRVVRKMTDQDGNFAGVIFTAVKSTALPEGVLTATTPMRTTATIVGFDNRVIYRSSNSGIAGTVATFNVDTSWDDNETTAEVEYMMTVSTSTVSRIVAHKSVDRLPLFVLIDVPKDIVLRSFYTYRMGAYILVSILNLLIAAIAVLICRRLNEMALANAAEEKERQEAEAKRLFDRIQSLMEDSPVGISIVSLQENKRLYVNETLIEMFGAQDAEELENFSIKASYARSKDYFAARSMSNEELAVPSEIERRRIDGSTWWCLVNRQRFEFNGEDCLLIWYHDVTVKRSAEESIRTAERDYKEVFENSTQGIVVTTPDGHFVRVNEAFTRMLGYRDPDDLKATVTDIGSQVWTNTSERREMMYALKTERRLYKETLFTRRDGSRMWVSMAVWGRWSDDGALQRIEAIIDDISGRKETEFALITAMDVAETANRAKSEFLSSMSHELRTPLNSILGFAQVLEMTAKGSLTEQQNQGVKQIINSGKHLLELIEDVLDLAKIEAGRATLNVSLVRIDALIKECVDLVNEMAEARGIQISTDIVTDQLEIKADKTRLKQVLINLISNAIKYNQDYGAISLTISDTVDGRLRIAIKDSGIGIPDNVGDDIFSPFNRLGAENLDVEGSGIGLTICKNLVEMMNGSIGYESIDGVGSTFWVNIPRVPLESATEAESKTQVA